MSPLDSPTFAAGIMSKTKGLLTSAFIKLYNVNMYQTKSTARLHSIIEHVQAVDGAASAVTAC